MTGLFRADMLQHDAIAHGELGASNRILAAGYNIASMDTFWYGHDFTNFKLTLEMCVAIGKYM